MSITVQLPKFEGPLALLLYLIRKEEMDIMDIKIHEITAQYLDYIKMMKELDLEVAGEFVAMASTLIHIKSKMLLPQYDENGEIIEVDDPRKELVQKLLEYQKYQEAAKLLSDRPWLGRDVWARGQRESLAPQEEEIELEDNALFSLISTYRKILKTAKKKIHQVAAKAQSIASRILEIKERLLVGHRVGMMDLVTDLQDRSRQVLITFLSLLELGKLGFVSLYQSEAYSEIWIEAKKPIETDVISRVEEYDNVNSEQIAAQMEQKAKQQSVEQESQGLINENPRNESELLVMAEAELESASENEFILKDAEDYETAAILESSSLDLPVEEMATDEEILAAELELKQTSDNEGRDVEV